jgi:hypothetical protein
MTTGGSGRQQAGDATGGSGTRMCAAGVGLGEDKVGFSFFYFFFLFLNTSLNFVAHINQDFYDVFYYKSSL